VSELLARLRSVFEGLAPRERMLVGAAGVLLLAMALWLGALRPAAALLTGAGRRADVLQDQLEEAARVRRDLDQIQGRLSQVENRIRAGRAGEIFTMLESLARESAVKVDSMEPQTSPASDRYRETKVQVVLKGVTLAQTVSYLHRIETAQELLSVKSLRIRTRPDQPQLLNVTFTVSSFEPV
jgi:general secretion pathway protein M